MTRHIGLQGASNFRDFGGYATSAGRVKPGFLYRADRLSRLTPDDHEQLEDLGLRLIIDLRRTSEREEEPTTWSRATAPEQWHVPIFEDDGMPTSLMQIAADPNTRDAEASTEMMREVYRKMIVQSMAQRQFAAIIKHLAEQAPSPTVMHCSGGKDRTGLLVALIQTALGVHTDDIYADFMLTQVYYDSTHLMQERASQIIDMHGVTMSEEALAPVFTVLPDYLTAAFQTAEDAHGSVLGFLDFIGIDAAQRERLQRHFID